MYLGMNLINKRIAYQISILSSFIGFLVTFLGYQVFNYLNISIFFLIILFSIVFGIINYFIISYSLRPLRKTISILKEMNSSTLKVNTSLENKNWKSLEKELQNVVEKFDYDIRRIEELGKSRTQFLANVSHELKTPIFTIKGFIETLLAGGIDDEKVNRKFLNKIKSQTFRLETIFTDLIDITRIESGDLKMNFDWFPFDDIIDWTKDSFEDSAN